MRLEEKVSVITGGAGGIGGTIAETFAKEGAKIAILDVNREAGEKKARELNGTYFNCDMQKVENIKEIFEQIVQHYGGIDVLVNCAGVANRTEITEISEAEWDLLNNVNLKAAFFASQAALKVMLKQEKGGNIVNISSGRALHSDGRHTIYDVTKAGLLAMTRSFAIAYAKNNIIINAVCPGYVLTPMTQHNMNRKDWYQWILDRIPAGQLTSMQAVANAALFLASEREPSGVNGQQIVVDGGWLVHD